VAFGFEKRTIDKIKATTKKKNNAMLMHLHEMYCFLGLLWLTIASAEFLHFFLVRAWRVSCMYELFNKTKTKQNMYIQTGTIAPRLRLKG